MSDASDAQEHVQRGVVSAVGSIGLATLASRVLGYVRDMFLGFLRASRHSAPPGPAAS